MIISANSSCVFARGWYQIDITISTEKGSHYDISAADKIHYWWYLLGDSILFSSQENRIALKKPCKNVILLWVIVAICVSRF